MNRVTLYPSAPALSPLCLGTVTFGREIDEVAGFALMDHAIKRGITFFDTASKYSNGASERIVGAWRASRRPDSAKLMIATKVYPPFTAEAMDLEVANSAKRLGVDVLDILYLHKWDAALKAPEALLALDRLQRSGRVRMLGVSNFTTAQLRAALKLQADLGLSPFRIIQNNNNLAVQDVDEPLRALCAQHGVTIVTYSPLGSGFLTGKHLGGVQPGSRFDIAPGHQNVYFNPTSERRLARLAEISAQIGQSMPHLALAWALHQPGIASVLVGGRTPAHLDQAFDALALNSPALFAALEAT